MGRKEARPPYYHLKVRVWEMGEPLIRYEGALYTPLTFPEAIIRSNIKHNNDPLELVEILSRHPLGECERWYLFNHYYIRGIEWLT